MVRVSAVEIAGILSCSTPVSGPWMTANSYLFLIESLHSLFLYISSVAVKQVKSGLKSLAKVSYENCNRRLGVGVRKGAERMLPKIHGFHPELKFTWDFKCASFPGESTGRFTVFLCFPCFLMENHQKRKDFLSAEPLNNPGKERSNAKITKELLAKETARESKKFKEGWPGFPQLPFPAPPPLHDTSRREQLFSNYIRGSYRNQGFLPR